ncbi:hypothetical protein ACFL2K_02835 [Candidatus Margulisiibacteriota bacterium]
MKMNRKIVRILRFPEDKDVDEDYVHASKAQRFSMVWDITHELWEISTKGKINAKSRLQRHIACIRKASS